MSGQRCWSMAGLRFVLVVALALGACAPRMTWTKEGSTEDELRRDQKACLAEADQYGFLITPSVAPNYPGATVAARQQGDIYSTCMAAKGYTEVPAGPEQPSQAPPAQ